MSDTRDYNGVTLDAPGRGRVYDSILETIGNTPLVRIPRLSAEEGLEADILLKLEFFNPLASVKDRIAVGMITALEKSGKIKPGDTLIEPTSGNTGIGPGLCCGFAWLQADPDHAGIHVGRAAQDACLSWR